MSEYLRQAKAGESVVVTDRGTPVPRLVPPGGETAQEGRVAELARAGLVRRPTGRLADGFRDASRPADPEGRSLESVLEERAEGW